MKQCNCIIINQLKHLFMRKFTLFLSMFVAFAMTAFAQTPISSPEEIQSGKIYWFDNVMNQSNQWGTLIYVNHENPNYSNKLWSSGAWPGSDGNAIAATPEDTTQLFSFIKQGDNFYLYSLGAKTFVSWKEDGAWLTDVPTSYITVDANTYGNPDFPWNIKFDGEKFIGLFLQNGYEYSGYLYCSGNNPANQIYAWQIFEVGELENTAELEANLYEALVIAEQQRTAAMDSLSYVLEEVDLFILDELKYSATGGGKIELQATDAAAGNYISCPQEHNMNNGTSDGDGVPALLDGNTGTFMHTSWGVALDGPHYLQIDLAEPLQNFSIAYHTRVFDGGNDFPDAIEVLGSNDGVNYTPITVLDKDLPQQPNKSWESGDIVADQPYKHLRLNITAERTYWHMSEFALYALANETAEEKYLPFVTYIRELVELYNEGNDMYMRADDKAEDIMAMITELNDLMKLIKGLASDEEDPETVEYIASVKEIYELQGVGYPTGAGRETFKAAIDAAEAKPTTLARITLAEALAEYYKVEEIILPTNGTKYTLTFVTYGGVRNYIDYNVTETGDYTLSMVRDTLTNQGLSYPETAVFTCEANEDGTFSFVTFDGKYLTVPNGASGSATGISESKVDVTLVKMYPNGKCETDVTYEMLFGLVAYQVGGTFPAPNSAGSYFYTGNLPHFMGSWTSAMAIEEYVPGDDTGIDQVAGETVVEGIYDLSGRRVENPVKGIYVINGKKVLVK